MGPSRRRRDERGVSALEMAFIAPAFLLVTFLIVQVALWFFGGNVALSAAREGASQLRLAAVSDTTGDDAAIESAARETALTYAVQVGMLHDPDVEVDALEDEDTASITVSGEVIDLVPFWDLEVSRTVEVRVERFRFDEGPDQ